MYPTFLARFQLPHSTKDLVHQMLLQHLHLPGLTRYTHASHLQSILVRTYLDHKALTPALRSTQSPPSPTLLTFETNPTYTCGRREVNTITEEQKEYLRCNGAAEFHPALRGGQTTFHGPGQLTAYLVLDLLTHGLKPSSYVRFLEKSVIETCASYAIRAFTTENPGVWTSDEDKIASVGVRLRRNVSSHGVGLNVSTDLKWFERIVACGLVGKRTTSFEKEGVRECTVEAVARLLAEVMATILNGVEGVSQIEETDALKAGDGEPSVDKVR